jgi:hypothetical protein
MCRSIKRLHNVEPPVQDEEVRNAALQFVRKIAGTTKPSKANAEAFECAVDEIAAASERLLHALVAHAPPQDREQAAAKARERFLARA